MESSPVQAERRPMKFYGFDEVIGANAAGRLYDQRSRNSLAFIELSPD
jgi:hypothetical protein